MAIAAIKLIIIIIIIIINDYFLYCLYDFLFNKKQSVVMDRTFNNIRPTALSVPTGLSAWSFTLSYLYKVT